MTNLLTSLILLAGCASVLSQEGVLLGTGESYSFEFTSLTYKRPAQNEASSVTALFSPGTFSDGESVLLEVFANTLSDVPRTSLFVHSGPAEPEISHGIAVILWPPIPAFFADLQGIVRVSVLSGDAELYGFSINQIINGEIYSGYFPVPEPSALALLALGLLCSVPWTSRIG